MVALSSTLDLKLLTVDHGADEDEGGVGTMVLVALRDVAAGEFLTVEPSDDDEDDEEEEDEEE